MFRRIFILISITIMVILLFAIGSLFFVANWHELLTDLTGREMLFSLRLSITTSIIATAITMLVSIPIGYSLSRFPFFGRDILQSIIDLPLAFPELLLGLCLLLLFGNTVLGKLFASIGINFVFTKLGVITAEFFTALPYAIQLVKATFDYINPRFEFVSRSLGYSGFETFLKISLPLSSRGLIGAMIIAFARSIGAFGSVLILAGGTYMKTETLPIALYLNISYGNIGMAIASGLVLIAVSFVAIFLFEKVSKIHGLS